MGIFSDFLNAGVNLGAIQTGINQARQAGNQAQDRATELGNSVSEQTKFKPFTVSTRTGTSNFGADGGLTTQLSPEQAASSANLFGQGNNLLSGLGQNVDARTQQLYNQLNSIRQPEIENQRLGLEERLFNQGRSGVQTSQFGGTGEQLAMEKAIQQQQAQDLFNARGLAQGERGQDYEIGSGLLGQSYQPEDQLLKFLTPGIQQADLANVATRQGAGARTDLGIAGINAQLAAEGIAGDLQSDQIRSLMDLVQSNNNNAKGTTTTGGTLSDFFTNLFGG